MTEFNKSEYIDTQVEYVLDYFDFDRAYKARIAVGWPGTEKDVGDLRQFARALIRMALKGVSLGTTDRSTTASGGFRVDVDTYADEAEKIYLRLSFVLTETDNYD
jgi:hypothetical protein